MHATIRRYEGVSGSTDELIRAGRALATSLNEARGFVSYVILEAGPGILATVTMFEDPISLGEADGVLGSAQGEDLAALLSTLPQITTGEIIFQRGL
jgi:hypothetical protein